MLENQLNDLNIYMLREVARRNGVVSPTSKKKDELIAEILAIKAGKQQPQFSNVRQGRPPKSGNYNFNTLGVASEVGFQSISNVVTFHQEVGSYDEEDNSTYSGYVEIINGSALLWINKNVSNYAYFIPNEMLESLNLKTGDLLNVSVASSVDQKVVREVLSVNGCPITKYSNKRKDYFDIDHVEPTKLIKFSKQEFDQFKIMYGESVYLYGQNNNNNTQTIIDMINSTNADDKLYINVSVAEKNKSVVKTAKAEKFIANVTDEQEKAKRVLMLAVERAKRGMEDGKNVVVAIDDVLSVASIEEDMTLTKALMSLTKNSKKGSITLFAIISNSESLKLFEKLADKRICING